MQESIIDFESCSRTSSARSAARFNHWNWNRHGSSTAISYAPGSTVQESIIESNSLIDSIIDSCIDSCTDSAAAHDFMQRRTTCARINHWFYHWNRHWNRHRRTTFVDFNDRINDRINDWILHRRTGPLAPSYRPIRDILEKVDNSKVTRPTKPFIPPVSMNWYQLRIGIKSSLCGLWDAVWHY